MLMLRELRAAGRAALRFRTRRGRRPRADGRLTESAVTSIWAAEPAPAVPPPTVEVSAFREAMGSFPTGVTVVTVASDDGNIHGITVNSFSSVSLDPMLVLICLKKNSRGLGLIERAGAFAVNVLSAGQHDLARRFANRHRPAGPAMFDGVPFKSGVTGCPVLVDATASFDCRLRRSHPAGDHLIVLGEVVALVHRPQLEPLIFHAGTYGAGRRSASVDSLDPCPVAWSRCHSSVGILSGR
jgi:flavin reductase (DIM6/NTAB) family NADH-FMN oxidoreductase RutF